MFFCRPPSIMRLSGPKLAAVLRSSQSSDPFQFITPGGVQIIAFCVPNFPKLDIPQGISVDGSESASCRFALFVFHRLSRTCVVMDVAVFVAILAFFQITLVFALIPA